MAEQSKWYGSMMQEALLNAEIVREERVTDAGPGEWLYLKLGDKIIPLGRDYHFADTLQFALVRNAEAFERPSRRTNEVSND